MRFNVSTVLIAVVVALVVASLSLFTVDQRQNAIVFRLGEIVSVKTAPGLFFKVPLVDNGVIGDPRPSTPEYGRRYFELRTKLAVAQIQAMIAAAR